MTQTFDAGVATDPSGKIIVFEAGVALWSQGGRGKDQPMTQLAPLLDEHIRCFVGRGPLALRALEAAHSATAPTIRIILDEPEEVTPEHLSRIASSEAIRRSDILILCGSGSKNTVQDCGRLIKVALPRATLMFTYATVAVTPTQRSESYWTAVRDFLRWGQGFIIKR